MAIRFLSRRVEVTISQQCIEDDANNTPAQTESEVEEQQAILEILGMKGCETNSQNRETFTMYNTLDLSNCPDELALLSAACEADSNFQSLIFRLLIANCTGFTMIPMDDNTTALVQVTANRHWEKGGVCLPKSCPSDANDLTVEDIAMMMDISLPGNVSCTVKYLEADSEAVGLEQTEDDSDAVVMEQKEEDSDNAAVLEQEEDDSGATTAQLFSSSAFIGLVTASFDDVVREQSAQIITEQ
ncbi:hypothetical protein FRACYDRAFT_250321 [Fragilariopsis cylindrus CCMP1102]|uniref:Uncharacterized protein n=1 Tax=Fragilariopsis cylindrus CCMP1102 TaxID=635003 RepID=A0A1E7EQB1_9STRA|nr:hypothetical protein FRACYDRAFT_250321 [Fragilariopsis cylindrus CCMP1102]|eukprot:OEU08099.1 hypothetical protein FRACYDRAFT_250321 [Fragilariopsis cylindrus CCMP1102]